MRQPAPETHPNGADRPGGARDEAGRPARPLEIRLLGRVELAIDGAEVRLAARGAQALLAVLALKPRIRSREAVATEIWPDGDGSGNSASLRQALWLVRSSFQAAGVPLERYLTIDAEVIGLQPCAQVELDVARFEAALRGPAGGVEDAIALYQGDLTECLGLECFAVERERLSDAYEDALAVAAERRLAAGDPVGARELAEKLLGRDPLREEAHATLLWVHGRIGSRAQVIRQYRRLAALLRDELGVAPLPETEAVYCAALAQSVERSRLRATAIAFGEDGGGPTRGGQPGRGGGLVPTIASR